MWRLFLRQFPQQTNAQFRLVSTTCSNKKDNTESSDDNLSSISKDPDSFGTHNEGVENSLKNNFISYKFEGPKIINKFTISDAKNSEPLFNCDNELGIADFSTNETEPNFKNVKNSIGKPFFASKIVDSHKQRKVLSNEKSGSNKQSFDVNPKKTLKLKEKSESDECNIFGSANVPRGSENYLGDGGDEIQEEHDYARSQQLNTSIFYSKKIKNLCGNGHLREAVKLLEDEMGLAGVVPEVYAYRVLIGECAKKGFTQKAFNLYRRMKSQGLTVKPQVYTMLFVACGNSHSPEDGLRRANKLREEIQIKGVPLNERHYHAMIRAFGRCGDLRQAFILLDDMITNRLQLSTESFNFLLQACISDKEAGFRHALVVWRKMRQMGRKPDIYAYNLLLRCTLKCGAGDPALLNQLLEEATAPPPPREPKFKKDKLLTSANINEQQQMVDSSLVQKSTNPSDNCDEHSIVKRIIVGRRSANDRDVEITKETLISNVSATPVSSTCDGSDDIHLKLPAPNTLEDGDCELVEAAVAVRAREEREPLTVMPRLLGNKPTTGAVVALTTLDEPKDRLTLLGGSAGFLAQMEADGVRPDLKSYTQLLSMLPDTLTAEQSLLSSMASSGVVPDITFCNMLIKKRNQRKDPEAAQAVLELVGEHHLQPDLLTYGCLATSCRTLPAAKQLLKDMHAAGNRPNLEIMSTLICNALSARRHFFALAMLQKLHRYDLEPDEYLVRKLEDGRHKALEMIRKIEKQSSVSAEDQAFLDHNRVYLHEYKSYLKSSSMKKQEPPWAYFSDTDSDASSSGSVALQRLPSTGARANV